MFETSFSYASATPIPPSPSISPAICILHDFETVIKLSPDCRGCRPLPLPKNSKAKSVPSKVQYWEVEDDLPFVPKKLWSGGVKYTADFIPVDDGCDITNHAPGGFTSINHWRILRGAAPLYGESIAKEPKEQDTQAALQRDRQSLRRAPTLDKLERSVSKLDDAGARLERTRTKDHLHTEDAGVGCYVQIVSDARCSRTFASFVKGALKSSHVQLQRAFIEKLEAAPVKGRQGRPMLGKRRSSMF